MEDKVAIVVVTYKRQQLLAQLLGSFLTLTAAPWRVVIVDNENSPATGRLVEAAQREVAAGNTRVPWPEGADSFVYAPQPENTGGAGGFSEGVRIAYELGAQWFWLMDDDVEVIPDSLEKLGKWMPGHGAIQGSRLDYDGGPFYWQYRFIAPLAIYNPVATAKFDDSGFKGTNTICFEGGMFSREVVEKVGFPDSRFFIYWDDCIYGYLASKVADSIVVSDVILKRTRDVPNWEVTGVRQLNSSSDMTRYYIMRNRGHMARYLQLRDEYNPVLYGAGTLLSFAKEFIRLSTVDRASFATGSKRLVNGWRDSRELLHDPSWQPMRKPRYEGGMPEAPDVSVIVPIYNAGPYLDQALSSLEGQTLSNIEIICVNDGSTDDSLAIMQEHASRDARIRIIDKPNGGYGSAMNRGLEEARGEWVAILEPDDWVEDGMYEDLVGYARSFGTPIDIVRSSYWRIWNPDTPQQHRMHCTCKGLIKPAKQPFKVTDPGGAEILMHHPSIWACLYRRAFLEEHGIRFLEIPGAGWADNPFLIETSCQAEAIAYLDKPYYNYREDTPEKLEAFTHRSTLLPLERWQDMQDVIERLGVTDEGVLHAQIKRAFVYISGIVEHEDIERADINEAIRAVFMRLDDDLVFADTFVSPAWKQRYAEMKGVECPPVSSLPYVHTLVRTGMHNLRHTGVRHTAYTVRGYLKRHKRRTGGK